MLAPIKSSWLDTFSSQLDAIHFTPCFSGIIIS